MDFFKTIILDMNNQIKKINLKHSFIFFLFCNIFSVVFFKFSYFNISSIICFVLILIIGISHGSLDHEKGKKIFKIFNIKNISYFYLFYILTGIFVIILWSIAPSLSLVIFLLVASYHFGKEDTQFLINKISYFDQILFFFKGLLIVLAPMFFHFEETVSLFKLLLVESEFFYSTLEFIEKNMLLFIGLIFKGICKHYTI